MNQLFTRILSTFERLKPYYGYESKAYYGAGVM